MFVLRAISGQGHDRKKKVTPGHDIKKRVIPGHDRKEESYCAADFSLLNLPKGKSLGRSKPATNS